MPVERSPALRSRVNGKPEEPEIFDGRRQLSVGGTSRMKRESHVRICERRGVKFPGPTRQKPYRGPPMTLGGAAAARVWFIFLC